MVRLETRKANKSLYFLLPILGIMKSFYKNNIINSFIADKKNRPQYDNFYIFILTKENDILMKDISGYIEDYKIEEGHMYVYKIHEDYEEDYLKFILGQYSQFSSDYKQRIIRLLPAPYDTHVIFKVITKSKEAKAIIEEKVGQSIGEQEVFSVPIYEEEIYE